MSSERITMTMTQKMDELFQSEQPDLKPIILMLANRIDEQDSEIKRLTNIIADHTERHDDLINFQGQTSSEIKKLTSEQHRNHRRTVDLERYSRKLCLTFTKMDIRSDPLPRVLAMINQFFGLQLSPDDIAACHPLTNGIVGPVIVKFIYHKHRDFIWNNRKWLTGAQNIFGNQIIVEECLAPIDKQIQTEAKRQGLPTYTNKQKVFVQKANDARGKEIQEPCELQTFNYFHPQREKGGQVKAREAKAQPNIQEPHVSPKPQENDVTMSTPIKAPNMMIAPTPYRVQNIPSAYRAERESKRRYHQLSPVIEAEDKDTRTSDTMSEMKGEMLKQMTEAMMAAMKPVLDKLEQLNGHVGKPHSETITQTES